MKRVVLLPLSEAAQFPDLEVIARDRNLAAFVGTRPLDALAKPTIRMSLFSKLSHAALRTDTLFGLLTKRYRLPKRSWMHWHLRHSKLRSL
jgi:hypothetical protein